MLNSQGQSWRSENMRARIDKCKISAKESDFIHFVGVCLRKMHVKHDIGQVETKWKLWLDCLTFGKGRSFSENFSRLLEFFSQAEGVFVVKREMTESWEWRLFRALFISTAAPGIVLFLQKDDRATIDSQKIIDSDLRKSNFCHLFELRTPWISH